MTDAPRITVDELKRRMDAGEDFTIVEHEESAGLGGVGHDDPGGDSNSGA